MKRKILWTWMLMLVGWTAWAQNENVKMRFDFKNVSGADVTDNISGVTAKLVGSAKVTAMGDYRILDLGSASGYLNLTAEAGKVFAASDNYTISVYYRVNEQASLAGNGYFLWAFSTSEACTSNGGIYSAYRLNAQRIASSTGGYKSETGYSVDTESAKGEWIHVAYTQEGKVGKLYINGLLKKSITNMPQNSVLYASTKPTACWMGRAPFSGDNYLAQTLIADFCLYDRALSATEVTALASETASLEEAYLYGTTGDVSQLKVALAEAKLVVEGTNSYLPDALEDLRNMVSVAESVVAGSYSQTYINKIHTQLKQVITHVKSTANVVLPEMENVDKEYDTARGFIHPGGLHTQADFDRIRRQLAEGNEKVKAAYEVLKKAEYAQPGIQTWPVETIVRGGGVGENYINAARGATMAYQNALRWKIEDNRACADAAVRILMAWANTTKTIGGDSNYALAAGLYGYQFAQAAELMRDYEGWSREEFNTFKQWMLSVWYPSAIGFLRGRNGTWENVGKWWQAPGHYWSNWGLCNALCVISIGVLCDDVYIYNQGMSYFKYDQVGNFHMPRTDDPIKNDGLTEYLGNLVVTHVESDLETGAYGKLGQMNESGRDTGHSAMALGLAIDIAKMGWNQGDDLFAYMDHRLAAGIEYVAAQTQSVANLPWTNYAYGTNGYYYTDSRVWVMTGPALGAQMRPYWGTVIGIYEGVKGVKMPFSEISYNNMGIDAGGMGSTSGGYDHMGYSVLMNTRDVQLAPADQVPTELTPKMEYSGALTANVIPSLSVEQKLGNINGKLIAHNELGGLVNTFAANNRTCVPRGETVKLMPQLPEGEEDTGLWQWETGEQTRDITVTTDCSRIYRVTYTNGKGVKSQQSFSIAVENDCNPTAITPSITYNGETIMGANIINGVYGESVTLDAIPACGWGTFQWSTGQTSQSITTVPIVEPRTYTLYYMNQGGAVSTCTFYVNVLAASPYVINRGETETTSECVINAGEEVTLGLDLSPAIPANNVSWSTGEKGNKITLRDLQVSGTYTASFPFDGEMVNIDFEVMVKSSSPVTLTPGSYLICHAPSGRLMTSHGINEDVTFEEGDILQPAAGQIWNIDNLYTRHSFTSLPDSLHLFANGKMGSVKMTTFSIEQAVGVERIAIRTGFTESATKYWDVEVDGRINTEGSQFSGFPFLLIPVDPALGIEKETIYNEVKNFVIYDLNGRRVNESEVQKGIYIMNGQKIIRK